MLFLLLTAALAQHSLMPGAGQRWSANYNDGVSAEAACNEQGLLLCTKASFLGACAYELDSGAIAADDANLDYNSVGWFKEAGGYTRGSMGASCSFSSWVPAGSTAGTAHCCAETYHNSGYNTIGGDNDLAAATAYCEDQADFPTVCTVRQVRGIAEDGENSDQGSVSSVYADGSVGWYSGSQQRWDGLTGWPASRGAHCCSEYAGYQDFTIPSYGRLPESGSYSDSNYWNVETADTACKDAGYTGLCTVAQQAQAANDGANVCFVGWAYKSGQEAYTPGYWGYSGCGTPGSWNDEYNPYSDADGTYPGAHCCKENQPSYSVAFPLYQTLHQSYQWNSADSAAAECTAYGDEYSLCSRGQLKKLATESFNFNGYDHTAMENMCNLGWTRESSGSTEMTWYQVSDECTGQTGWLTIPNAQYASYHCCQGFEADDIPTPVYETLQWAYFSKEDAAAQCRDGMSLCSRDQLAALARGDVTHNGQTQAQIRSMCSQGWTSDAGLGWWQYDDEAGCVPYGTDQMNAFSASTGTYHCCSDFAAESSTRPYETRQWFYYTNEEAAGMCGTGAQLCTQEQVYRVATQGVTHDGMTVEAQDNICSQGWFQDGTKGWWQVQAGCGDTPANSMGSFTADTATFHCCLDFDGLALPTEAPETDAPTDAPEETDAPTDAPEETDAPTDAPEETDAPTDAPVETDVSGNLPSAQAQPEGCSSIDFTPSGFADEVSYCVSDGMVYLDGYSTCIPDSSSDLETALQNSWDNDWFFGSTQDCTGRDTDATTDDQLWVTNKMCDNLEADITATETAVSDYMTDWKADVTDIVNANLDSFDAETQAALTQLLNDMNGN